MVDDPRYVDRVGRNIVIDEFILTRIRVHAAEFARGKRDARARVQSIASGPGSMILDEDASARSTRIILDYLARVVAPQPRGEREEQATFADRLRRPPHGLNRKQAQSVAAELFSVYATRTNDLRERFLMAGCEVDFDTTCEVIAAYDEARSWADRAYVRVDESMFRERFALWTKGKRPTPSTQVVKTAIDKFEGPASRYVDEEAVTHSIADLICDATMHLPRARKGRVDPADQYAFKQHAIDVARDLLPMRRLGTTLGQFAAGVSSPWQNDVIDVTVGMSYEIAQRALVALRPHAWLIHRSVPEGDPRTMVISDWGRNFTHELTRGLERRQQSGLLDIAEQWCPMLAYGSPERLRFSELGIRPLPDAPGHVTGLTGG